ncbi:MAG: hypothetical protein CL681_21665 [Blastopirellula sp.]|nr:hypothetical protein [Blastopirellula sp.]
MHKPTLLTLGFLLLGSHAHAQWKEIYTQDFDSVPSNTETGSGALSGWERNSALGVVYDGKTKSAGRFLIARHSWNSFNQGPILNLDLTTVPHDRVKVSFDLYTFGDWRGFQRASGGPLHRLMFFDSKAQPRFAFDTCFATNRAFQQAWPSRNNQAHPALTGSQPADVDTTGRFPKAHRWPVEFEYPSDSPALRFTILCGAAAGSGTPMPPFGIDRVRVAVRSTAPTITVREPSPTRTSTPSRPPTGHLPITFNVTQPGRTSVGLYDPTGSRLVRTVMTGDTLAAGKHTRWWDGRDDTGKPLPAGEYLWKRITVPGFQARYVTTIGINPPGGEHPTPRRSWVGDHVGAGTIDVTPNGIFIGSTMTEGMMMALRVAADQSGIHWRREQFYEGGRLTRISATAQTVYLLHPTGKLRKANAKSGDIQATWDVGRDEASPSDLDSNSRGVCLTYPTTGKVVWRDHDGKITAERAVPNARLVALVSEDSQKALVVTGEKQLVRCSPDAPPQTVGQLPASITALDFDRTRQDAWIVLHGHQVVRLDQQLRIKQSYGERPRPLGPYHHRFMAGVSDIAADGMGGYWVTEPSQPPRRVAHYGATGELQTEWYGGMSFYVSAAFDPVEPEVLYGIASEGYVHQYRIDFDSGQWTLEACYHTGRLGDGMFPNSGGFRAVRQNHATYLYHRVVPSVIRLDPKQRRAVPVAVAGRVLNQGRTFVQFAGTGQDGYPQPWVAAAKHSGYADLSTAPKLYSWADTNGDGKFQPQEFVFYETKTRGVSFHNPGDYLANGDYVGATHVNEPQAIVHLPVTRMEGPQHDAPRWDWSKTQTKGTITANSYGYGSPRSVTVTPDGAMHVTYQAGIMIHEHGQYEGGGWPEKALRGSRLLTFDNRFEPRYSVGRQSKTGSEANQGVFFYPMQSYAGPNHTILVNDQTKQPAQVWSQDGLFLGSVFDRRAKDGLADGFYQVHGDDNQGGAMVRHPNGKTYWLMPYQAHNRLYEVTGWDDWQQDQGTIRLERSPAAPRRDGKGLTVVYSQKGKTVYSGREDLIYYERFGPERHADKFNGFYKATWEGYLTPAISDLYQFQSLLGANEQLAIWIDGKPVHARVDGKQVDRSVQLTANHPHAIRVEYINPEGRAELNVLWSSQVLDVGRIPVAYLHENK